MVYFTEEMSTYLARRVTQNYDDFVPPTRLLDLRRESQQGWVRLTDEINRTYNAKFTLKQVKEKWHGMRKEARHALMNEEAADKCSSRIFSSAMREKPAIRIIKEMLCEQNREINARLNSSDPGTVSNSPIALGKRKISDDDDFDVEVIEHPRHEEYYDKTPTPRRYVTSKSNSSTSGQSSHRQHQIMKTSSTDLTTALSMSSRLLHDRLLQEQLRNEAGTHAELNATIPTSLSNAELQCRLLEEQLQNGTAAAAATNGDLTTEDTVSTSISIADLERRLLEQQLRNEQLEYENKRKFARLLDAANNLMDTSLIPLLHKMDAFYSRDNS